MRFVILSCALIATACSKEQPAAPALATGNFAGSGRDALCISGAAGAQRAGFVVYGADNANCSASGRVEPTGTIWTLNPAGDANCKIQLTATASGITLGPVTPACGYYCGPGASYASKSFNRSPDARPATDLAGGPLC